jgi:hypothetical protein
MIMGLAQYMIDTRDLIKDTSTPGGLFWTDKQLTRYINLARQQVATLSGCIRILIPGQSPFGGQAVAGQMIPGAGTPGMPLTNTFQTIPGVEKYSFRFGNDYVKQLNQNVKGIGDVITCAVSWGGSRPALDWLPWEDLQAYARSYNIGVTSYPFCWSTYGDGERGQVWLFPIPTNALEMEWDTFCVPTDIFTDDCYDALPSPFSTYVPFYAAHLAFLNSQRYGQAATMLDLFYANSGLARVASDRGKTKSFYNF